MSRKSPQAVATPRRNCPPREVSPITNLAPQLIDMFWVSSVDPPSEIITSRIKPESTPSMSDQSVLGN